MTEENKPEELSLRDELSNAFKEANEKAEPKELISKETPASDPAEKPAESKAERARDETGKFAKKEDKEELAQPKEAKIETPSAVVAPAVVESKAPNSWSATAKAKWNELPAELRAEINKRETEVHQGFTRMDEDRQFGKTLKEIVSPYMPIIQAEGGTPVTAIQSLLNSAYILRTGTPQAKTQLFQQLAREYGVNLQQISQAQPAIDPQVQAIQQELARLKNERQQELSQREQQEQAAVKSTIDTFAADPSHPHFEAVRPHMSVLLKSGLAVDLQDAYDQAVHARPDIRSTLIQSQAAELEANRIAEAKVKADAARKASVSIKGGPGASAPSNPAVSNRSLREELQANFRELAHG